MIVCMHLNHLIAFTKIQRLLGTLVVFFVPQHFDMLLVRKKDALIFDVLT
jgi:hypothetical protein